MLRPQNEAPTFIAEQRGPMTTLPQTGVTDLLVNWGKGDKEALNNLIPLVYDELHKLASRYRRRERPDHTLQTTALVHEAYLKLVDQRKANWENRVQFFAVAAQLMRRILVDYARGHRASKRGGDLCKLSLEALDKLAVIDSQQSRVVELRVFAGLTLEETAQALNISPRTVRREWGMAKAWLHREIKNNDR